VYVLVADGGDVERFLRTLHDRCWLNGLGWMMVGAAGQLLERSIVDRMVYAAERLVFEGAPILDPPLERDQESRAAVVRDGVPLDTLAAYPPLRIVEKARLDELRTAQAHRLAADRARARETFIAEQTPRIVAKSDVSLDVARGRSSGGAREFSHPQSCCRSKARNSQAVPSPPRWRILSASWAPRWPIP
jgi:hypothetical protein